MSERAEQQLATAKKKLLATDHAALPPEIRESMIAEPMVGIPIASTSKGLKPKLEELPWETAPRTLFPKLGVKSWRDGGRLQLCPAGWPVSPHLDALLNNPTEAQRATIKVWANTSQQLHLYLFPYLDFSGVTEARFLCSRGEASLSSICKRGSSAELFAAARPKMRALVEKLAPSLPMTSAIFDVGLTPGGAIRIVDVNPGLTPQEVKSLMSAPNRAA
ncbi:MAG: hypothetical protein AAF662_01100 [Pseudomonadota bacterium]